MIEKTQKLGEILVEKQLIQREQLANVLEAQRTDQRKLGEILTSKGLITEEEVAKILAAMFSIRFVHLTDKIIQPEALGILPNDILQTYKVFPISLQNKTLTLATNDPLNVSALQDIQYRSGYLIEPIMASLSDINRCLEEYDDSLHAVSAHQPEQMNQQEDGYVVKLVDSLIRSAIREKASDIHLEPMKESLRVRFRVDGVLYERSPINQDLHRNVIARLKIMGGMDVTENRKPQDGRLSFVHGQEEYDLRLSSLINLFGEDMVIRLLNKNFKGQSFEELGMEEEERKTLMQLIHKPYGLILVTGPTGAGKTTTLYSMLKELNDATRNIISVEDPVEYAIEGINQTTTNKFTEYTFATAMRYILRHDPDVIMLGEIRDVETADAAIRAALTGHLVLSTVHTNSAAGAITRLLEMDIEPFLIASAVKGVVAQRLVRKLCPKCQMPYELTGVECEEMQSVLPNEKTQTVFQSVGCEECLTTGFSGREAVYEVLTVDEKMKEMILHRESERAIMEQAVVGGMKSLRVNGVRKAVEGKTTMAEIIKVIANE